MLHFSKKWPSVGERTGVFLDCKFVNGLNVAIQCKVSGWGLNMNMKVRGFGSLALAASASALPMGGTAQSADMPVKTVTPAWTPQWTFSAEGGLLVSNYSRTSF